MQKKKHLKEHSILSIVVIIYALNLFLGPPIIANKMANEAVQNGVSNLRSTLYQLEEKNFSVNNM